MNISTKSRYALRMMIELAIRQDSGFTSLNEVAATEGISIKYLEHIAAILKNAGLIKVQRGAKGGYILAHQPSRITAFDIIKAAEGNISIVECCTDESACSKTERCTAREVWVALKGSIESTLSSFTLEQLKNNELENRKTYNYEI